ncbi:MAG: aminotransferase class I/II-fold pyridoxal phosphate-dependent enzyme [Chloroflexi bacterium]|nr:aminotransferase class I/II-fold pyridoxal phosphate-dependent enzyme [Chloroflexota bacterium]
MEDSDDRRPDSDRRVSRPITYAVETRAVHAGERARPSAAIPTATPIHRSTTFVYDSAEELDAVFGGEATGYVYSRISNPTVEALEKAVGSLEGAAHCVAFGSGMAALHAALLAAGVAAGDRVVASIDLYATTFSLLNTILAPLGVRTTYVDLNDPAALAAVLADGEARAVLVESISNPLLRVADIPALAVAAHAHGATLIVDATFTPPPLGSPLAQGADLVVHSATKYLGGHADITAGIVYGNGMAAASLRPLAQTMGALLAPNEAWLLLRGVKTLPLRLRRQCATARLLARRLAHHPRVARVHFPGLSSHPQHAVARRLLRPGWYGGMISFELRDAGPADVHRFLNCLRLCLPATSLGDIYSLVSCPAMASHRELSPRQCQRMGISPALLRLSVGIEHPADLAADLLGALDELERPVVFTPAARQVMAGVGGVGTDDEEPAP